MRKIIIRDKTPILPFNEPACKLRVLNKPLWLYQQDVLARHCSQELEVNSLAEVPASFDAEIFVYRDNLFFDQYFIDEFVERARAGGKACQVAFSLDDQAIVTHALPLQEGIRRQGDVYVADMWYFPRGVEADPKPLVIDTEAREMGYYHLPTYFAIDKGEVVFQLPLKSFLSIENWIHVFVANCLFGTFSRSARADKELYQLKNKLKIMWHALVERKQVLSSSPMVQVGKNCSIDPSAVIQGPTIIGDNVTIEPGAVITQSIIGSNVSIMQGCQVQMSVVGDGSYLSFRAAVTFTTLMERCTVAQNACLQLCVIGRNSFIGAGNTFTDFNLIPKPINVYHRGKLLSTGRTAMGSCVGHNCRIGAGFVIYPGRMIESDTVLAVRDEHFVIAKNVGFDESHHHRLKDGEKHQVHYPHHDPELLA
ncbi:MAG: multidrug transporter [Anaerolineaceae bacterium 4572_32.1]|nr:MAG: multidrug transporter [Anaerolineaceae bacterium 4572_32.1]